jgi:hypothetical protein
VMSTIKQVDDRRIRGVSLNARNWSKSHLCPGS